MNPTLFRERLPLSITSEFVSNNAGRPQVNWCARDLDDSSSSISWETILQDYARSDSNPQVYKAWIPLWLLSERLWEEVEASSYRDWSKYKADSIFPPLKIEIEAVVRNSMSYVQIIHIRDGNHRARFWKQCGFIEAPAWVLDYRSRR